MGRDFKHSFLVGERVSYVYLWYSEWCKNDEKIIKKETNINLDGISESSRVLATPPYTQPFPRGFRF